MARFSVATLNVNSIRSRLHIVIPWLEKHRPSVFCMQETKVEDEKFPRGDFENIGYHVTFRGQKRYSGVAIASLEEPANVVAGLGDEGPADEERLLQAVFSKVRVISCYLPQGRDREHEQFKYKLEWFRRLRRYLERFLTPDIPVLLCGDLNVAREEIDVHDPKRLLGHVDFTPEVWEGFDNVLSWGFTDVFRKHHSGEPGLYSFYDYRVPRAVERGLGWRVDHILATEPLAKSSVECSIDLEPRGSEKPSDHTVMFAVFEI